jgi:hypothetical protein
VVVLRAFEPLLTVYWIDYRKLISALGNFCRDRPVKSLRRTTRRPAVTALAGPFFPGVASFFELASKWLHVVITANVTVMKVQFPTTRFKIIFANDTLSETVLKSRGLGVEISSRASLPISESK